MRVILANGCFDLLHAGHVAHLREARAMGDKLIVALTLDEFVGKPGRPVHPWEARATMLRELRCVDEVIPSRNGAEAIAEVKPAVYVKGLDYAMSGLPDATVMACAIVRAQIRYTRAGRVGTTEIIERIRQCA